MPPMWSRLRAASGSPGIQHRVCIGAGIPVRAPILKGARTSSESNTTKQYKLTLNLNSKATQLLELGGPAFKIAPQGCHAKRADIGKYPVPRVLLLVLFKFRFNVTELFFPDCHGLHPKLNFSPSKLSAESFEPIFGFWLLERLNQKHNRCKGRLAVQKG
eukprot:744895-Rhodomonas_salina.1